MYTALQMSKCFYFLSFFDQNLDFELGLDSENDEDGADGNSHPSSDLEDYAEAVDPEEVEKKKEEEDDRIMAKDHFLNSKDRMQALVPVQVGDIGLSFMWHLGQCHGTFGPPLRDASVIFLPFYILEPVEEKANSMSVFCSNSSILFEIP